MLWLIRYLVYQNAYKTVLKWNETRRTWVPSAGLVLSFYNDTRAHGAFPGVIPFIWHDANNDGAWRLTNEGGPDWSELSIFRGFEATDGGRWTFLADLVSWTGRDARGAQRRHHYTVTIQSHRLSPTAASPRRSPTNHAHCRGNPPRS